MRAAARTATAQWTDRRMVLGRAGRTTSRLLRERDALLRAVGTRFALAHAVALTGMIDGQAVPLAPCLVGGRPVVWDYWWPHLGIAVDVRARDDAEEDAKVEWANTQGVLYCSPTVNGTPDGRLDLVRLTEYAAERRRGLAC